MTVSADPPPPPPGIVTVIAPLLLVAVTPAPTKSILFTAVLKLVPSSLTVIVETAFGPTVSQAVPL